MSTNLKCMFSASLVVAGSAESARKYKQSISFARHQDRISAAAAWSSLFTLARPILFPKKFESHSR